MGLKVEFVVPRSHHPVRCDGRHEGCDEGDEGSQSDEGDENQACVQGWQESSCLQGWQGKDHRWPHEVGPDQEQGREDCLQEGKRTRQENVWCHQGLDGGSSEGSQAARLQGFRPDQEGISPLRCSQGPLQEVNNYFGFGATSITPLSLGCGPRTVLLRLSREQRAAVCVHVGASIEASLFEKKKK